MADTSLPHSTLSALFAEAAVFTEVVIRHLESKADESPTLKELARGNDTALALIKNLQANIDGALHADMVMAAKPGDDDSLMDTGQIPASDQGMFIFNTGLQTMDRLLVVASAVVDAPVLKNFYKAAIFAIHEKNGGAPIDNAVRRKTIAQADAKHMLALLP